MSDKKEQVAMAIVKLHGSYLMPVDDAYKLIQSVAGASRVEWDWSNKCHKYVKPDEDGLGSFKLLSHVDVAKIALESDD